MASSARTARLLVLLQITLVVVFAMVMTSPVCLGEAYGVGTTPGALNPDRPACIGRSCPIPGYPYVRPRPGYPYVPGRGPFRPPRTPALPPNGDTPRP
ncbi:hypothetical protein EJB05_41419 [Eragrostis curvula]|uniref:Uncharacterized protein n=1 Tax=Eragrostis curvula TaxID=38414 RepID=A0A5J9T9G2_9POAL|nr:hypothetical protein EJB05_41413 [Eragrostis curvula]TVU08035.1 hypothetical protein EJB05_41419 [Eragrostis curvula]